MDNLTDLPNIGTTLANKLKMVGINNLHDLAETGSRKHY